MKISRHNRKPNVNSITTDNHVTKGLSAPSHTYLRQQTNLRGVPVASKDMVGNASSGAGHLGAADQLLLVGEDVVQLLEGRGLKATEPVVSSAASGQKFRLLVPSAKCGGLDQLL